MGDILQFSLAQNSQTDDEAEEAVADILRRTDELLQEYSMRDIILALMENATPKDADILLPSFRHIVFDNEE
jgi:hypothetical protein